MKQEECEDTQITLSRYDKGSGEEVKGIGGETQGDGRLRDMREGTAVAGMGEERVGT